ncbi:uncharacterized protein LOC124152419 isoform X2 [Haliotis rufescens]|uniref:uncharacterized protein LOC124152419 isoform X2 n=1 Tax=Haliotis rufescens TaxID=6454 RepID=UPI00201F86F4|nr:uncharacterized protein LOC124152419 isoform X2 [Haliotis rufescens]
MTMDPAAACGCPSVDVACVVRRRRKQVDFSQLGKGAGNLSWFEDLTHQARQKQQQQHLPDAATPRTDDLHLAGFDSPCFLPQPVELMQATTPGIGSLTPLSAWALLSSQDPSTSTPTSVDHPIIGNRLDSSCLASPTAVESCLKTCRGISERLGLTAANDDCNMSWTNSMATPCHGGELHTSQEAEEVPTPPKPKGFPRALFSPDQGRTDSDELVKELNATMDEEVLSGVSPGPRSSWMAQTDRGKNLMRELFLRSTAQTQELLQDGSPRSRDPPPQTGKSSATPRSSCKKHQRRNFRNVSVKSNVASPLAKADKSPVTSASGLKTVIDIENKDVQLKINILQMAASFEGDISTLPNDDVMNKQVVSDTEADVVNHLINRNQTYQGKGYEVCYSDSAEQSTSSRLNRRVRSTRSQDCLKQNKHLSSDQGSSCVTLSVVNETLSMFVDSPSGAEVRRRSAPLKGKKRKSTEACLLEGDVDALFSTPSPHGSQATKPHSILSSSKKRKHGSGGKKVRFAENLCRSEEEGAGASKKLNYAQGTDSSRVSSSVSETVLELTSQDSLRLNDPDLTGTVKPDEITSTDFQPEDNNGRLKQKGTEPVLNEPVSLHADGDSARLKEHATEPVQNEPVSLRGDGDSARLKEHATEPVQNEPVSLRGDGDGASLKEHATEPVKDKRVSLLADVGTEPADGEQPLFESQSDEEAQSGICQSNVSNDIQQDIPCKRTLDNIHRPCKEHSELRSENCDFVSSPSVTEILPTETEQSLVQGAAESQTESTNRLSVPNTNVSVCQGYESTPVRPIPVVHDEMFSQISPSSLTEMCLVASSDQSKLNTLVHAQEPPCSSHRVEAQETISDITDPAALHPHSMEHVDKLVTRTSSAQTRVTTSTDANSVKCPEMETAPLVPSVSDRSTLSHQQCIDKQTSSTDLISNKEALKSDNLFSNSDRSGHEDATKPHVQNLFAKKPKAKRFLYPTSSQIKAVCPKTVFSFKGLDVDAKASAAVGESEPVASDVAVSVASDVAAAVASDVAVSVASDVAASVASDVAVSVTSDVASDVAVSVTSDVAVSVTSDVAVSVASDVAASVASAADADSVSVASVDNKTIVDDVGQSMDGAPIGGAGVVASVGVLSGGVDACTDGSADDVKESCTVADDVQTGKDMGVGRKSVSDPPAVTDEIGIVFKQQNLSMGFTKFSEMFDESLNDWEDWDSQTGAPYEGGGHTTSQTAVPSDDGGHMTSQTVEPADGGGHTTSQTAVPSDGGGHMTSPTVEPADGGGHTTSQTAVPSDGGGHMTSKTAVPSDGGGHMTSQTAVPSDGGGHRTSQTAVPSDGGGHRTSQTAVPSDGGGHMTSKTVEPADGGGHTTSQTAVPSDGGGHMTSQTVEPADGGGHRTSQTAVPSDGDGHVTSQTAVPSDGGGHMTSQTAVHSDGGGPTTSQTAVPSDGGGQTTSQTAVPSDVGGPTTSQTVVIADGGGQTTSQTVVMADGGGQTTSQTVVMADGGGPMTSQTVVMADDGGHTTSQTGVMAGGGGHTTSQTVVPVVGGGHISPSTCTDGTAGHAKGAKVGIVLPKSLSSSLKPGNDKLYNNFPSVHGKDVKPHQDVNPTSVKVSGTVDNVFTQNEVYSSVEYASVVQEPYVKDDAQEQVKACRDLPSGSQWLPTSQYVHNMVKDVQEELFSDIEFSQVDGITSETKEDVGAEPDNKDEGQDEDLCSATSKKKLASENMLAASVHNSRGQCVESESSVSVSKMTGADWVPSAPECPGKEVFKKPDVPGKASNQRPLVLSDSDTDAMLSDMELFETCAEDTGKPLGRSAQENPYVFSSDVSGFESNKSEDDVKNEQKCNVHLPNCVADSSLSDSDTDLYVTSTEEIKELSPEVKHQSPRKSKMSTRSRTSRKDSILLSKSLMICDSDSDVNCERNVSQNRKGHYSETFLKKKPTLVNESDPDILWSDLETYGKSITKDDHKDGTDCDKDIKNEKFVPNENECRLESNQTETYKMGNTSLALEESKSTVSVAMEDQDKQQPGRSNRAGSISGSESVWSDLEQGEAEILEEETVGLSLVTESGVSVKASSTCHQFVAVDDEIQIKAVLKDERPETEEATLRSESQGSVIAVSQSNVAGTSNSALLNIDSAQLMLPSFSIARKEVFNTQEGARQLIDNPGSPHIHLGHVGDVRFPETMKKLSDMSSAAFSDFATASGQQFNQDQKPLQKVSALLESDAGMSEETARSFHTCPETDMSKTAASGFSTASGKRFSFDPKSLQKASALLESDAGVSEETDRSFHTCPETDMSKTAGSGFSTASGKRFSFDPKSLQKATTLLETGDNASEVRQSAKTIHDLSENVSATCLGHAGFSTASGRKFSFDPKSLQKATALLETDVSISEGTHNSKPFHTSPENVNSPDISQSAMTGFSTANGRKFSFDPKSLQKATALLETNVIAGGTHNSKPHKSLENVNSPDISRSAMTGFSTANGRKFSFDPKSLQKASALLETDVSISEVVDTDQGKVIPGQGTRKSCSRSRRHKTCIDIAEVTASCAADSTGNLPSFSTASGKELSLNKDALQEAQTLMKLEEGLGTGVNASVNPKYNRIPVQNSLKTAKDVPHGGCELESMLDDLLKSKKSMFEKQSKEGESNKDLSLVSHTLQIKKIEDVLQTSADITGQPTGFRSPSGGFSTAGKKGLQIVGSKSMKKGDPMLKPKGFRPFKKPRIVPKPKTVDSPTKHMEVDSSLTSSGFAAEGGGEPGGRWQTTPEDLATKQDTDSELSEIMLLEFSHDMTELSQCGYKPGAPQDLVQTGDQGHSQAGATVQAGAVTSNADCDQDDDTERDRGADTENFLSCETPSSRESHQTDTTFKRFHSYGKDKICEQISEKKNVKSHPFNTASEKRGIISEEALKSARSLMPEGEGHTAESQALLEEELFRGDMSSQLDVRAVSAGMEKTCDGSHPTSAPVFSLGKGAFYPERDSGSGGGLVEVRVAEFGGTGFQTASGRQVCLSEEALRHAKVLWNDLPSSDLKADAALEESAEKQNMKMLNVCDEQLDHVVPNICNSDREGAGKDTVDDQRTDETSTSMDQEAPRCSRGNRNLVSNLICNDDHMKMSSNPFQTASGKGVSVSAAALNQARQVMSECRDMVHVSDDPGVRNVTSSLDAIHVVNTRETDRMSLSSLFQTASGKGVTVSDSSLSAARKTMTDDCVSRPSTSHDLFQTASGKGVTVNKQSLAEARKLMKDADETQLPTTPSSSLFQTASGNAVTVSDSALVKSREIFADEQSKHASLFKTASGTSVGVSANALVEAQNLLQDNCDSSMMSSKCLFQTASGTSVGVSSNALVEAQKLLQDNCDSSMMSSKSLFQTASGVCVGVSTEALAKGRRILEEGNEPPTAMDPSGSVLQTDSGRVVCLSESSSRKLLDDTGEEGVVPECGSCSVNVHQTRSDEELHTLDGQRKYGHRGGSKTPMMSSPESTHLDRLVKGGRRLQPLTSTSLRTTPRSGDYDLDAILNKSSEKLTPSTTSSFKTPYKNTAFITPVRKASVQDKHTPGESNKTPVFYPKASLRANQKQARNCPTNHSGERPVLDRHSSCKNSPTSTRSGSGNNTTDETRPSVTSSRSTSGSVISHRASPMTMQNSSGKAMSTDSRRQTRESVVSEPLGQNTECVQAVGVGHMSQPGNAKLSSVQASDAAAASIDLKHHLQEVRQKQGEIIQRKKKQKVRPSCGRLLREKQSPGLKLQHRDLVVEGSFSDQELCSMGVRREISDIGSNTAEDFRFNLLLYYPNMTSGVLVGDGALLVPDDSGFAGKEEFHRSFVSLESVDPALISDVWVFNHYRWIVWKLASYETSYPAQLAGRCLTPNNMMLQLKYRYDREVDRCQRSALKKIVERDDAACKRMVLCVSGIRVTQSGPDTVGAGQCVVELTDGWYCIKGQLDVGLAGLVASKKISVGQKICVSGAELAGSQEACPPLEIPDSLFLKICMNSTRPAPGDSKLGYQRDPRPLCVPISTLHAEGGVAGCVDVVVTRIYPVMYMEKLVEGGSVFRTEEVEERVQRRFDRHKQDKMEKLYTELQASLEQDQSRGRRKSRKRWSQREVEDLQTGQEIYDAVEGSLQPEEVHSWLSEHQAQMMDNHRRHLQDLQHQQLQDKLHTAWEEAQQGHTSRNVTPVLKLRVSGCAKRDVDAKISTIVTVWRPNSEWLHLLEGKRYKIYGLVASPAKTRLDSHSVHLTANRQTKLQPCPVDENYLDLVYDPREVWSVRDLRSRSPPFKEFDFVGMVITSQSNSQQSCDTVYVSDADGDILSIRFWAGLQSFGLEDQMVAGKSIVATNLILKWSRGAGFISADACNEVTRFSSTSKIPDHRKCLARFTSFKQAEKGKFLAAAKARLSEQETRPQAPHTQLATPQMYFSDLPSECLQKLFSPMEDQGEKLSKGDNSVTPDPVAKKRRSILREKSAKLMAYGSPNPLSPLSCPVSPAVARAFKLPSGLAKNMKDSFK